MKKFNWTAVVIVLLVLFSYPLMKAVQPSIHGSATKQTPTMPVAGTVPSIGLPVATSNTSSRVEAETKLEALKTREFQLGNSITALQEQIKNQAVAVEKEICMEYKKRKNRAEADILNGENIDQAEIELAGLRTMFNKQTIACDLFETIVKKEVVYEQVYISEQDQMDSLTYGLNDEYGNY